MADKEVATMLEVVAQLVEKHHLRGAVEVDDHVTAEDDVLLLVQLEIMHEIESLEANLGAQDRVHLDEIFGLAAQDVLLLHLHGDFIGLIHGVYGTLCFFEDFLRDVGGENVEVETGMTRLKFIEDHRQSVRLFAA